MKKHTDTHKCAVGKDKSENKKINLEIKIMNVSRKR
jgi:hypothetical protein